MVTHCLHPTAGATRDLHSVVIAPPESREGSFWQVALPVSVSINGSCFLWP